MNRRLPTIATLLAATMFAAGTLWADERPTARKTPRKTLQAWSYEDAMEQLRLNPGDVYLQYVALQLARGEGEDKLKEAAGAVEQLNRRRGRRRPTERRVDLFALFTGALAVQESLQLDTMRGDENAVGSILADPAKNVVKIGALEGPTVKSHPWGKMLAAQHLAGKRADASPLAFCVPEDQFFVLFRSLTKLLEASEVGDLWGAHLFAQASKSAQTHLTTPRIKRQLAMQTDPLTRPFYDMVVDEVAMTGADLYFTEGSDVTFLFSVKQPEVFRIRMDGFLAAAEKSRSDAVRSTGKIEGVEYVRVATPDRAIHVFSAYPRPDLHVRGNSKVGLQRVLAAIAGRGNVGRLGDATEFKYIRTLMTRGDEREHGFVYLSDSFIRRLVGPQMKLCERRRMICYNHLRMIGHASMLYRTQFGEKPESIEQLVEGKCLPQRFGETKSRCPCGGRYELSADGATAVCSHHGRADQLVPCCEIPLARVTEHEGNEYQEFVTAYSRYWRRFFDPIAIRIQLTPGQYRAETIILPLIDNSVYTGLATVLGGEPEPLDTLPVPGRNIFSINGRFNKELLLKSGPLVGGFLKEIARETAGEQPDPVIVKQFIARGIGNQIGMHVYDASPMFDFNLTGFMGEMLGTFRGGGGWLDDDFLPFFFLIASLNSPVYLSVPVEDAQIVDKFLDEIDASLAALARKAERDGWFDVDFDFYRVPLDTKDDRVRCYSMSLGPVKWRMFFGRIDDGLYIASKRFILDDLAVAAEQRNAVEGPVDKGPTAHAMVRVRPQNWDQVLPGFRLGWAESSRHACLNNLGPLSSVARTMAAESDGPVDSRRVHREADQLHAVHFFCPDGGRYEVSPDGRQVICSVHGTAAEPKQLPTPAPGSPMGRLMKDFSGLTAQLIFLEDGLHAVVTVDRK